ncbi:MAG: hypothetical protein BWY57_01243 [Betaproteobacteria bacterium ADurb.Bin341]|nr:MAG: hypothetical protein BWY57_01243 [Betaproteobacteria bacterium ADurb.Bin341]
MKRNTLGMTLIAVAVLFAAPFASRAAEPKTPAPAAASAADSEYEKSLREAQASADAQARQAEIAKRAAEKQQSDEAAEQKRKEQEAAAEKAKLDSEEARRRDEQIRLSKIEEQKRLKAERERSCVIKPVMTDAEIANCKKVRR